MKQISLKDFFRRAGRVLLVLSSLLGAETGWCFRDLSGLDDQGEELPKAYNLVGVALFSGRDLVSQSIKLLERNKTSHNGLIVVDADADPEDQSAWYCLESTGTMGEVLKRRMYPHVRLGSWESVAENYSGKVKYRRFRFDDDVEEPSTEEVTDFVKTYINTSYTKNPLRLFKALAKANKKSRSPKLKTAFCSELVAQALIEWGMIDEKTVAGNVLPKAFAKDNKVKLCKGVTLDPAVKFQKQQ